MGLGAFISARAGILALPGGIFGGEGEGRARGVFSFQFLVGEVPGVWAGGPEDRTGNRKPETFYRFDARDAIASSTLS